MNQIGLACVDWSVMSADQRLLAARRSWWASAQELLVSVTDAAEILRTAFEGAAEDVPDAVADPASAVIAACNVLTGWVAAAKAPRGLAKARAELGAVAGVYRNAAYAFRHIGAADTETRMARMTACGQLLDQGDHHVDVFASIIARKVIRGSADP